MTWDLSRAIALVGAGQLCVLFASALVPVQLQWKTELAVLPRLIRQMYWIYGGYVVLSIISLGTICLVHSTELASGTGLARAFCGYACAFWLIRLSLQPFLAAKPYMTRWWLTAGYHMLTVMFATFAVVMGYAALRGVLPI
ncbi:hypothetical protein AYO47_07255 [Planctomyces sp. SCGC AG-212-M04]|nr:hypothetical protein AYO47_07255 [Planctomyces sp. SCGC AG-212-M04]